MKSNAIRVLAMLALVATPVLASPILVSNFSFEDAVSGLVACGANCSAGNVVIPSWTASVSGPNSGIFNVTGPGTYWSGPPTDGVQSAYAFTAASSGTVTLSQTVVPTAVAGTTYQLRVDVGQRLDLPGYLGTADILVNGNQYFVTCGAAVPGGFVACSGLYTATAADNGKSITLELSATTRQGNFDNVRLDTVPEPASFLLFGSALLVLSKLRRRRATNS